MSKTKKVRVTDLMVDGGLAPDVKTASALIMAGQVVANERRVEKASEMVTLDTHVRLKKRQKYVSRAGMKIHGAIEYFGLVEAIKNKVCLDVGASTGGFTECLLNCGAEFVYTVDVGTNQLDWKLRKNPRVIVSEKTDFRAFDFKKLSDKVAPDFVVADVSFISLITLIQGFIKSSAPGTKLLLLVKPQFEIKRDAVPVGGVVDDLDISDAAVERVKIEFEKVGFIFKGIVNSQIKGRSGNQEVFLYLERS